MDVDDLYGLPFDRFVPERTALARELRSAGRREEAGEVAALRKPSVAAWAVNQLVRTQRRGVDELFEAGDALREAHDQVLGGRGDAGSLRTAVARERAAVDELIKVARGVLTGDGHELSPTIIDRVTDTLHAAALDDDARAQVGDGRLERELRQWGSGWRRPLRAPRRRPGAAGRPPRLSRGRTTKPSARRRRNVPGPGRRRGRPSATLGESSSGRLVRWRWRARSTSMRGRCSKQRSRRSKKPSASVARPRRSYARPSTPRASCPNGPVR